METAQEILTKEGLPVYNLDAEQEKKEIVRYYRALMRGLRPKLKKGDRELVRLAFEMAAEAHKTMRRKSGEPYILHPIAVAMICGILAHASRALRWNLLLISIIILYYLR